MQHFLDNKYKKIMHLLRFKLTNEHRLKQKVAL